jgi:ferredoxin
MSTYKVVLDQSLCSGFGTCAELAPSVFALEGPTASVRVGETDDPTAIEAASSCPMGAIAVFEAETGRQAA